MYYYDKILRTFKKSDLLVDTDIFSLVFGKSGSMWAGTNNGLYNIKKKRIINSFISSDTNVNTLLGNSVLSLAFDKKGDLWIGTDRGLCLLEQNADTILRQSKREGKYLSSRLTRCIYEDREGNIWVGTTDKGINKIEANTGKIIQYKNNL